MTAVVDRCRPILLSIGAVVACAGAVAGCGGGKTDKERITGVVDRLQTYSRTGDGTRICKELFTENLAISVARASRRTCAAEVRKNVFDPATAFQRGPVSINGKNATMRITDQAKRSSNLLLQLQTGGWRIARIG